MDCFKTVMKNRLYPTGCKAKLTSRVIAYSIWYLFVEKLRRKILEGFFQGILVSYGESNVAIIG